MKIGWKNRILAEPRYGFPPIERQVLADKSKKTRERVFLLWQMD